MSAPTDLVGTILAALDRRPPYEVLDVLREHLEWIGATNVRLWLADYDESTLEDFVVAGGGRRHDSEPVETPGLGTAYREQQCIVDSHVAGTAFVYVPVTVRSERLGVLEVQVPDAPDDALTQQLRSVGTAVAYTLLAARRFTDMFELVRRRRELELPAEVQWELLPVLAHTGPDFSVAGSVEPAYDIGGDNFDYAVDQGGIVLSLTDAMGHGTQAALLSTLAVSAQRNARRHGGSLRQQVHSVNRALHDHFAGTAFATGLFIEIDRATGEGMVVNAGHSFLWRLRDGNVDYVDIPPDLPTGLFADTSFVAHPLEVRPGDRFILVSDGVLEAAGEDGDEFQSGRLRDLITATADAPPVEVVRRLTAAVAAHVGTTLADDATAMCLDYRRGTSRPVREKCW
jgi:serine/threonine protein phosphatase PrpC